MHGDAWGQIVILGDSAMNGTKFTEMAIERVNETSWNPHACVWPSKQPGQYQNAPGFWACLRSQELSCTANKCSDNSKPESAAGRS